MFQMIKKNIQCFLIAAALIIPCLANAMPDIGEVINCFAGKNNNYDIKPFFGPIRLIDVVMHNKTYHFYGVHFKDQESVDFGQFNQKLLANMGCKGKTIVQVVGDSNRFSAEGTSFGRKFVRQRLHDDAVLEYGYTGYKTGGQELDANSFLNEFVDENPEQAGRMLANVLGHTVWAINKWGCYVSPHVHHFVVVYNDAGITEEPKFNCEGIKTAGFTTFGDDVKMSDFVCNKLICLEGGAQSFLQTVNVLQQGNTVEIVYNLRKPDDTKMFSAARFLQQVDVACSDKVPSKKEVWDLFAHYASKLNSMFNETKPDYKTKKALFEKAISAFIDGGLYERVHSHCTFYNAAL